MRNAVLVTSRETPGPAPGEGQPQAQARAGAERLQSSPAERDLGVLVDTRLASDPSHLPSAGGVTAGVVGLVLRST